MYSFLSFHFILVGSVNFLNPHLLVDRSRDSFSLVASVCFPFSSVDSIPPSILFFQINGYESFSLHLLQSIFVFPSIMKNNFVVCWNLAWYCFLDFEIHCFVTSWIFKVFLINLFWFWWGYLCMTLRIFIWFSCFSCRFPCSVYLTIF